MIRNVFTDQAAGSDTLLETDQIVIRRISAQKQELAPDSLRKAENNFVLLLRGQLIRKDKTTLMPGDYTVFSSETNEAELAAAEEDSVWLSARFKGKVERGLFPSPDALVLKNLKENIKRNDFKVSINSLVESSNVRVERLASDRNSSSAGTCKSPTNQFVLALEGHADLDVDHEVSAPMTGSDATRAARLFESRKVRLSPGDFVCIPANTGSRIDSTADGRTVLLSIYFGGNLQLK